MKNVSYYASSKDKTTHDAFLIFQKQLDSEGQSGTIDNTTYTFIVRQSSNPLNEFKEDRKILCSQSTPIHRGSIVVSEGITYLVVSDVDTNGVYKSGLMRKCNNTLKWKDADKKIITTPMIITNLTLYSDGLSVERVGVMADGKRSVTIPVTNDTKKLFAGQRFLLSKDNAFSISLIDDFSEPGILIMTMVQSALDLVNDDRVNLIAYNDYSTTNTTTNLSISGDDYITAGNTAAYSIANNTNNYTYTWEVKDINGLPISYAGIKTNNITSCEVITYETTGLPKQIKLYAKCLQDSRVVLTKIITVKDVF